MAGSFGSLGSDDALGPDGALDRFAAELRVDEAARSRSRRASLDRQAAEEATFRGVLVDLGERHATVSIDLVDGRTVVGSIFQVGADVAGLRGDDGHDVLVCLGAVVTVTPRAADDVVRGDRLVTSDLSFVEALSWLAGTGRGVQVRTRAGTSVQGELAAVGLDVVALVLDGPARRRTYVATSTIIEVLVPGGWA